METKKVLVTGCAGFIGFHVCRRLLSEDWDVLGVDNLDAYYDVELKMERLSQISTHSRFRFVQASIQHHDRLRQVFEDLGQPDAVIHLAAQAGVRHSIKDPQSYIDSNLAGFANVLEGCRHSGAKHLVFASSSSVYGANTRTPFSPHASCDHPLSLYAATKRANELMAHSYAHLFHLPVTGLRFFTVYGPWGRPDMAPFIFTRAILAGEPITVFNFGKSRRDFTYIDDAVEAIIRLLGRIPRPDPGWTSDRPDPASSEAPFRVYNVGNQNAVELLSLIHAIEAKLGRKAIMKMEPLPAGDVPTTFADVEDLVRDTGFRPSTPLENGIGRFVDWFRDYYHV